MRAPPPLHGQALLVRADVCASTSHPTLQTTLRVLAAAVLAQGVRADYWAFSTWIAGGYSDSANCAGLPDETNVQL